MSRKRGITICVVVWKARQLLVEQLVSSGIPMGVMQVVRSRPEEEALWVDCSINSGERYETCGDDGYRYVATSIPAMKSLSLGSFGSVLDDHDLLVCSNHFFTELVPS
jgi:hypothetical protein